MTTALPYAVYHVRGADAFTFLQGQLTCDMRAVDAANWRFAAYCSPQGKVLISVYVAFDGEGYFLLVPAEGADAFIARLKLFILRSAVHISADSRHCYAIASSATPGAEHQEGRSILQGMGGAALYVSAQPPEQALALADFTDARIIAGIAEIVPATSDQFLPQMLGMPAIEALSFHKGCFVGQEGIARLQYKGANHRLLAYGEACVSAAPGDALYAEDVRAGVVLTVGARYIQAVVQDRYLNTPLALHSHFIHFHSMESPDGKA